jgi:NAD(P)-dependent dehydrogenase (short-subunit alcohol dehydrogenase family)
MKIQDLFSLKNKVVIVTGGLGQLGKAYVEALLENDAKVAIIEAVVNESRIPANFKTYIEKKQLCVYEVNITKKAELEKSLEQIKKDLGAPFGLINNAAIDSPPNSPAEENGPFETYPESSWDNVLNVNLKGTYLCCQVYGAEMAKNNQGSIINISSIYGVVSPDQNLYEFRRARGEVFYKPVAYSASKSGIINLTKYLATYWARKKVRVNTLVLSGVFNNQEKAFLDIYNSRMPVGRMAETKDYLGAVIYLLSEASNYTTGTEITIDGGWTAI